MDEKTNLPHSSRRKLILVLVGLLLVIPALMSLAFVAVQYKTKTSENTSTTSKQTEAPEPPLPAPPSKPKAKGVVIGPGESAEVDCGVGTGGIEPILDSSSSLKYTTIGGEKRTLIVYLVDKDNERAAGARLKWTFGDWGFGGSLEIEGCSATFTPPASIGTAYNAGADFYIKVVLPTSPSSKPVSPGEGGPIFAGYVLKQGILVYDSNNGGSTSCYDPAGVAVSINSVPTSSNVEIVVNTPRYTGRSYNSRVATIRDGPGTYDIYIYVNGSLYDSTTSQVGECQLATVKW